MAFQENPVSQFCQCFSYCNIQITLLQNVMYKWPFQFWSNWRFSKCGIMSLCQDGTENWHWTIEGTVIWDCNRDTLILTRSIEICQDGLVYSWVLWEVCKIIQLFNVVAFIITYGRQWSYIVIISFFPCTTHVQMWYSTVVLYYNCAIFLVVGNLLHIIFTLMCMVHWDGIWKDKINQIAC